LQNLPARAATPEATDDDAWDRANALAVTLTEDELLAQPPATLARRLFWQEQVLPAETLAPRFQCTCSRARIGRMLISLGREEVESIVADMGSVSVTCDFCNARHEFDRVDVGQLFATGATADGQDATRQ
jgi:molecular chaperone Hsp33